jgi:hypothetical protein
MAKDNEKILLAGAVMVRSEWWWALQTARSLKLI